MNGYCIAAVAGIAVGAIAVAVAVIIYVATQNREFPKINRRIDRINKRINEIEDKISEKEMKEDSYEEYHTKEYHRRTRY